MEGSSTELSSRLVLREILSIDGGRQVKGIYLFIRFCSFYALEMAPRVPCCSFYALEMAPHVPCFPGAHCGAEDNLEHLIRLPPPPECWIAGVCPHTWLITVVGI